MFSPISGTASSVRQCSPCSPWLDISFMRPQLRLHRRLFSLSVQESYLLTRRAPAPPPSARNYTTPLTAKAAMPAHIAGHRMHSSSIFRLLPPRCQLCSVAPWAEQVVNVSQFVQQASRSILIEGHRQPTTYAARPM